MRALRDKTNLRPVEPPGETDHTGLCTDLYAFVSLDAEGDESLLVVPHDVLGVLPLVSGCRNCVERLRPYAEMIARTSGMSVKLVHWTTRTTLDLVGTAGQA